MNKQRQKQLASDKQLTPPITDILSLPNGIPTRILRLEVWLVATASRARLRLLVSCNHIFVTIFLREALGNDLLLPGAPSIIFSLDDRRRDLGRVLDVLDLATSWGPAAVAPHAARGFLTERMKNIMHEMYAAQCQHISNYCRPQRFLPHESKIAARTLDEDFRRGSCRPLEVTS